MAAPVLTEEGRPKGNHLAPTWNGNPVLFIILLCCVSSGPAFRRADVITVGTLFEHVVDFTFSDSEWLVVTDVSFQQFGGALERAEDYLRKTLLPRPQNRRRAPVKLSSAAEIQEAIQERAYGFQEEFLAVQGRYNELRSALLVAPKRARGELLDVGGHALNWLFGVATDKDYRQSMTA